MPFSMPELISEDSLRVYDHEGIPQFRVNSYRYGALCKERLVKFTSRAHIPRISGKVCLTAPSFFRGDPKSSDDAIDPQETGYLPPQEWRKIVLVSPEGDEYPTEALPGGMNYNGGWIYSMARWPPHQPISRLAADLERTHQCATVLESDTMTFSLMLGCGAAKILNRRGNLVVIHGKVRYMDEEHRGEHLDRLRSLQANEEIENWRPSLEVEFTKRSKFRGEREYRFVVPGNVKEGPEQLIFPVLLPDGARHFGEVLDGTTGAPVEGDYYV